MWREYDRVDRVLERNGRGEQKRSIEERDSAEKTLLLREMGPTYFKI